MFVVNRAAIVGIDERQVPELRALIEVRNAGRGHLDYQLREAVPHAVLGDELLKRPERSLERPPRVEQHIDKRQDCLLVPWSGLNQLV